MIQERRLNGNSSDHCPDDYADNSGGNTDCAKKLGWVLQTKHKSADTACNANPKINLQDFTKAQLPQRVPEVPHNAPAFGHPDHPTIEQLCDRI